MDHVISFVRVLYTASLILYSLGLFVYYTLMFSATSNGHGSFSFFSLTGIIPMFLFFLLFISRILHTRSSKWLWLGLPTVMVMYGFIGYILVTMLLVTPY